MTDEITAFCLARIAEDPTAATAAPLRAIVALYTEGRWRCDGWDAAETAVYHVAAIWQSHPDYREEWTP